MIISIKSEIDSRVMIYPLLRSLHNHGSVLLLTTNIHVKRVIDGDYNGDWRGMTIIISETGDTDDVYEEYGIGEGDFDYVILDNMGVLDFNALIVLMGKYHSESFADEVKILLEEDPGKVTLVQYGSPLVKKKTKEEIQAEKELERVNKGKKEFKYSRVQTQFPKYEDFESVEGTLLFPKVDTAIAKAIFKIIKDKVGLEESVYLREVGAKDESSGNISRQNELWEI